MTQTLASWALDYVTSTSLATKLTRVPRDLRADEGPALTVPNAPGRPAQLVLTQKAAKAPGPEAMRAPEKRAQLVHTFFHHELQAAELMAWAVLRFADAPTPFLRGLAKIADDEIRHMQMYGDYLAKLGFSFGDFPVRDWFWERVPSAPHARAFLATFGMGFEAGNLDHTRRFAERFRAIGDEDGARLQEVVGEEEVPHVKFAVRWYARFAGEPAFGTWASSLPSPLSPMLMRGKPLDREARLRAGFSETFLNELEAWQPNASGT